MALGRWKEDLIKIVAECANKFLNCIGISAEQVHKILQSKEGRTEGSITTNYDASQCNDI